MRHVLGSGKRKGAGVALALAMVLLVGACGGSSSKSSPNPNNTPTTGKGGSSTPAGGISGVPTTDSKPTPGGSMTMALEAETSTGYCLPEATLAISGIQVARAVYDYLTVPDVDDNYVPELASAITHNPTYTQWTIQVRPGIKFTDGSALDAKVVKDNLDAYRGTLPARQPILFKFVFQDVTAVTATGPMTVQVDLKTPWVTFPAHLYEYGRLGIMGEKQLTEGKDCAKDLVGTGPFMLKSQSDWVVNDHMTLTKNPNYWRKDKDGVQLPYLDSITFKPTPDPSALENGVQSQAFDLAETDSTDVIFDLASAVSSGSLNMVKSEAHPELGYTIFNTRIAPFNNILARRAFMEAFNKPLYNQLRQHNLLSDAQGPFGPGTLGYLANTGLPEYDLTKAKADVKAYEQATGTSKLAFTLTIPNDSSSVQSAEVVQGFMKAAGITMGLKPEEQQTEISDVIYAGITPTNYQAAAWRNHPGFDPDTQYVWWSCSKAPADVAGTTNMGSVPATELGNNCDNLVNFSGFNDATINKDLNTGRTSSDPAARKAAYEDLNKEFAKQDLEAWSFYALWTIPAQTDVEGILGPNLPTATNPDAVGASPFTGLASGIDVSGLWKKSS